MNINGFLPSTVGSFDPVTQGYPSGDPTTDDAFKASLTDSQRGSGPG